MEPNRYDERASLYNEQLERDNWNFRVCSWKFRCVHGKVLKVKSTKIILFSGSARHGKDQSATFLKEELDSFFSLVRNFTDKNNYLFYTHNIHIEKGLEKEKLLDNLNIFVSNS